MNNSETQYKSSQYHTHLISPGVLLVVFAILIGLTAATVAVTWVDLGQFNVWIAMLIAAAKAGLVALYFMHLRYDSSFNALILVVAILFTTLFIAITLKNTEIYTHDLKPPADTAMRMN